MGFHYPIGDSYGHYSGWLTSTPFHKRHGHFKCFVENAKVSSLITVLLAQYPLKLSSLLFEGMVDSKWKDQRLKSLCLCWGN